MATFEITPKDIIVLEKVESFSIGNYFYDMKYGVDYVNNTTSEKIFKPAIRINKNTYFFDDETQAKLKFEKLKETL